MTDKTTMVQSEGDKSSTPANDSLAPKPPDWLRNLLWYWHNWRRYWPLLLGVLLVLTCYVTLTKTHLFFANSGTSPRTYKLVDFEDAQLRRMIEESTGLKFDMSEAATYSISFGHTGNLRPGYQEGYYLFDGGSAVILINGSKCCEIQEVRLTAWSHSPGNPKDDLEGEIRKELERGLKSHRDLVANCILAGIGNEE